MSVKRILGIIVILTGVVGVIAVQPYRAFAMLVQSRIDLSDPERVEILGATLQIEMYVPVDASGSRLLKADGLASLVRDGNETLLVTHDHWGDALQEKATIKIYDAQGRKVKSMSGSELLSRMTYLDAGTLIFHSPVEWDGGAQPATQRDADEIKTGDIVLVAQRVGSERMDVELVEAEVEATTSIHGLSVYSLRDMHGQLVQRGDSGGGVWYAGKLVGNLWYTQMLGTSHSNDLSGSNTSEIDLEATSESYAAIYPADQFVAFQKGIQDAGGGERFDVP